MAILVTGGAGYIGSHTVIVLLKAGFQVVVVDSLSNGSAVALQRAEVIAQRPIRFVNADIRDRGAMDRLFSCFAIETVIHFAGLKAVAESVREPLAYYSHNVGGTLTLCQAMEAAGVRRIIFSSSATVYGNQTAIPYVETSPRGTTASPYGTSKAMAEQVLEDLVAATPGWSAVLLRYFNPIGAHPSGRIGEDPLGIPNNLLPFMLQVAIGRRPQLTIYGNDYPTEDGTCQRDYLHVMDLAQGHLCAIRALEKPGIAVYNLGGGQGISVLEMVKRFADVTGIAIPYAYGQRRHGDLPAFWADSKKVQAELGWKTQKTLDDMLRDSWRWQRYNPQGYASQQE